MIRGMETSASAMKHLQLKQDIVANNIANSDTVAFKEQLVTAKSVEAMNVRNRLTHEDVGSINPGIETNTVYENSDKGTILETGIDTDFAILEEAFFKVEISDGNYAYTRSGNFHTDMNGKLVTDNGYAVMGKNTVTGNDSYIYVGDESMVVSSDGTIQNIENGTIKFNIVEFEDTQSLSRMGKNLYTADGIQEIESQNPSIKQKALEGSNLDLTTQMVKMIEVSREYSANQRALKNTDETLQKTVNELGSLK
ncbi:flagellar hook-basal body complex protein [Clostridium grantii]|uniref:Flagellar basal-body rod protein FlgG n=1 Tax=Clostridium grantii DSM 8605 TaxID=1121316 RepID=A0A1M5XIP4_9CLOT|nr:flagellar hook-basal body complex protein [Clostridium grantii]SHH99697.1 flagellar basal-body rod protein FlgG [Clostridium grantii DSM 8605]